uniref:Uncharacterized protein n=1 Tax=Brassica oleracea var. oleracea TaxID=109376 RepID=A0A0D3A1H4_BRAOL
ERQTQNHHLFHLRAQDTPLTLVTADLQPPAQVQPSPINEEEDPFESTGFITAFSTWSLEPNPIFARSSLSFSGHLAELERTLELASNSTNSSSSTVVVDSLRAYMQIVDVASILGLDCDISEHAFERSQLHPMYSKRRLGKYIKILGEALQLSQPINSNSISVHMPRFCTLLQLNKSAQLEDKRKTQAEICKITGLTLRKVYKELLENWDDLLPSNYTPAVPPEKAFSTTRSTTPRAVDPSPEPSFMDRDKPSVKPIESLDNAHQQQSKGKEDQY